MKMNRLNSFKMKNRVISKLGIKLSSKTKKAICMIESNRLLIHSAIDGDIVFRIPKYKEIKSFCRGEGSIYSHDIEVLSYGSANCSPEIMSYKLEWVIDNLEYINGTAIVISVGESDISEKMLIELDEWLQKKYPNFYRSTLKQAGTFRTSNKISLLESFEIETK